MSSLPAVSVVIPVYNGAKFVESCIRHLREQTLGDIEVLFVVDHKTTDGTEDAIREVSDGWDAVRIIRQEDDLRMGGARNLGLQRLLLGQGASGEGLRRVLRQGL